MTTQSDIPTNNSSIVVALHSSASGGQQWNALTADLEDRYAVITPDLPGYGNGPARPSSLKGLAAVAKPLIEYIETFGTPVHLVGHSFGGAVALKIALLRSDLIKSLSLYEPAAFSVLRNTSLEDRALLFGLKKVGNVLGAAKVAGRNDLGMKMFIDFWNQDGAWEQMPENLQRVVAQAAPTVCSDFRCVLDETWACEKLSQLTMPALFMMGMDSPAVAQRTVDLIASSIPGAERAILPGLGHMAPVQSPDWVNPRILQHIARAQKAATRVSWSHRTAA